jgi:hypothetical protein
MEFRTNLPNDPTRPMRRMAIQNSIARKRTLLRSVGQPDLSPTDVAGQARLRIERAKTVGAVEKRSVPPETE